MKKSWISKSYIFAILFFALGFFNIVFAWLGFACITLPFIFLIRDGKKTWCQSYCPRASLFTALFNGRSLTGRTGPMWLIKDDAKWVMLAYFSANLSILIMSTLMVFKGRIDAVEKVRFMIAFQLPWDMPQMLNVGVAPKWTVHLAFRVYSMMFTTTVIGLILGWVFRPRTWCTICAINTISDISLRK